MRLAIFLLSILPVLANAASFVKENLPVYSCDASEFSDFDSSANISDISKGFAFRFQLNPSAFPDGKERVVFEIPGTFKIYSSKFRTGDSGYYCGEDFSLNFDIFLSVDNAPSMKKLTLKMPMSKALAAKEIIAFYNGVNFVAAADGLALDEEFPAGTLDAPKGSPRVGPDSFKFFQFSPSCESVKKSAREIDRGDFISFYRPSFANVGDVVTFAHGGVFHILYLYDRHNHGSRWGKGAHYYRHIVSRDLKNWLDIGPVLDIKSDWESVGTATMIYKDGNYLAFFGMHTSRIIPEEKTARGDFLEEYKKTGAFSCKTFGEIAPKYPIGASYAISADGVNFRPSNKNVHPAENPSVYVREDGSLLMFGNPTFGNYSVKLGNVWRADSPDGPWTKEDKFGFPCGRDAKLYNTEECPSFFSLNGWNYLLVGFDGFYCARDGEPWRDSAAEGFDIYDGVGVPMVSNFGGRLIYAGWIAGRWGSVMAVRELLQRPDGRLDMRWLPEQLPDMSNPDFERESMPDKFSAPLPKSELAFLELDVSPKPDGKLAVRIMRENGKGVELQLDFSLEQAQWNECEKDVFAKSLPPIHKAVKMHEQEISWGISGIKPKELHFRGRNFSIANVDCMKKPFKLRVAIKRDGMRTYIDAEIAGLRTIATTRFNLSAETVQIEGLNGTDFSNLKIKKFQ